MKKRLFSSLLVLCMVLTLFPAAAFAESEATSELSEISDETELSEAPAESDDTEVSTELDTSAASDVTVEPAGSGILFLTSMTIHADELTREDNESGFPFIGSGFAFSLDSTGIHEIPPVQFDLKNSHFRTLDEINPNDPAYAIDPAVEKPVNTWCMYTKNKYSSGGTDLYIYTLTEVPSGTSASGREAQFALDVTDTVYIDKNHTFLQNGDTKVYVDDNTFFANASLFGVSNTLTMGALEFSYQGISKFGLEVSELGSADSAGFTYPAAEIYALYDSDGIVIAVITIGGTRTEAAEYTVTVTHNAGGYVKYGFMGWYNIASGGSFTVPYSRPSIGAVPNSGYAIGSIVVNGEDLTSQMRYDSNGGCQAVEFSVTADTRVAVTFVSSGNTDYSDDIGSDSGDDETGSYVTDPTTSGGSTTVEISARITTSGSTTKADIRTSDMDKAVDSAVSEAARQGTAPVVEIDVRTYSRADSLELSMPASSLEKLAEVRNSSLVITSNVAEVALDHTALGALVNQAAGSTITLEVAPVEPISLNITQREAVGTAPVVDLSLVSGRTAIHEYNNGVITVSLPYTLTFGQSASDVVVYYLESYGGLTPCNTSYADGKVTFTTTHLSKYVIGDKRLAEQAQKSEFTDVPASAYYADAVDWAVANGIAYGVTDTTFGPDAACTRAQIVSFLWRQAGSPKMSGANSFTDVSATDYYYDAVLWAVANGITYGSTDTTFSPDSTCTRAQAMTFLYRDKKSPAVSGTSGFTDVPAGEYYADAVQWAVANNVTYGTSDTTFGSDQNCTRAQIVSFMYRAR